jgi:hypothetical protein
MEKIKVLNSTYKAYILSMDKGVKNKNVPD